MKEDFPEKGGNQCVACVKKWHADHYQKPHIKAQRAEQGKLFRINNKEKAQVYDLKSRLKTKYNLSLEEYAEMLERQGGGCAICGGKDPKRKGALRLFVDHCKVTGEVRGLLCHPHNIMLGQAEDKPEVLRSAALYLEKSRKKNVA